VSQSTDQLAPGLQQTASEVRAGLALSASKSAAQQADAHRFIVSNGHQVVVGHADVGDGSADRGRQAGGY
jgi:hypothetical protein